MYIKLSEIKITPSFEVSTPQIGKINKCRENYSKGIINKKIVINRDNELTDGYILYLVLRENNVISSKVKVINVGKQKHIIKKKDDLQVNNYWNKPTTYVFGKHKLGDNVKEFVWRLSSNKSSSTVNVGDYIMANTKYGNRKIIATRVDVLDSRPIDMKIRKCWIMQ